MSNIYPTALEGFITKEIDLVNDTIKVVLLDDNHAFNADDETYADISANEITGTGYTAGGQALNSKTVTEGTTTVFDADDLSWSDAEISAYHAVLVDTTVSDKLICSIDFGGEQTITDGLFKLQWNSGGIITLS